MSLARSVQPQGQQQVPDTISKLGGWLFRRRTSLPLPIAAALLLIPAPAARPLSLVWAGVLVTAAGEGLRLWGVGHIGVISRTRSDRLGPLIDSGPFGLIRNPLYVGNILLWAGFAISAGLPWLAVPIVLLLALEYHAIVRWEETLLDARHGSAYRSYAARVPRWVPRTLTPQSSGPRESRAFSWRDTLFSERGTLVAIAAGYALLWMKTLGRSLL